MIPEVIIRLKSCPSDLCQANSPLTCQVKGCIKNCIHLRFYGRDNLVVGARAKLYAILHVSGQAISKELIMYAGKYLVYQKRMGAALKIPGAGLTWLQA